MTSTNLLKELMMKWKAIRDNFVRCHRQRTETGTENLPSRPYIFYNQLKFIIPHTKGSTQISSNIHVPKVEGENNEEDSHDTPDRANNTKDQNRQRGNSPMEEMGVSPPKKQCRNLRRQPPMRLPSESFVSTTKELTSILTEDVSLQKEQSRLGKQQERDLYGHQAFLMSFVPVLNSMPLLSAMKARVKITEVITEALITSTKNVSTSVEHGTAR